MHKTRVFRNIMEPREVGIALAYLPVHVFLLPSLLIGYTLSSGKTLSQNYSETIYFGIGLVVIVIFLWSFLRSSFDILMDNFGYCLMTIIVGVFGIMMLSQFSAVIMLMMESEIMATLQIASEGVGVADTRTLFVLGIGAVPVVEETLFRGLIFGAVRKKSRALAYLLSVLAYVFYSIWQSFFIGANVWVILILVLSYIPEAVMLAWCYERSGTIWVPIILSASISTLAMIPFMV